MKADRELVDYIKKRYQACKDLEDIHEPNGDDRFKHIYFGAEKTAFKEILLLLEEV